MSTPAVLFRIAAPGSHFVPVWYKRTVPVCYSQFSPIRAAGAAGEPSGWGRRRISDAGLAMTGEGCLRGGAGATAGG